MSTITPFPTSYQNPNTNRTIPSQKNSESFFKTPPPSPLFPPSFLPLTALAPDNKGEVLWMNLLCIRPCIRPCIVYTTSSCVTTVQYYSIYTVYSRTSDYIYSQYVYIYIPLSLLQLYTALYLSIFFFSNFTFFIYMSFLLCNIITF